VKKSESRGFGKKDEQKRVSKGKDLKKPWEIKDRITPNERGQHPEGTKAKRSINKKRKKGNGWEGGEKGKK